MRKRKRSGLERLRQLFFWYPGGLWVKRVGNMIILFSIGLNLYVNFIQDELLEESECMINEAEATLARFEAVGDASVAVIRDMDQAIGWSVNDFWEALAYREMSKQNNKTVQIIEESRAVVTEYNNRLKEYGSVYAALSLLLRIITWLFWIRVAISLIWILGDLIYGNARRLMTFFLLFAAVFDVWIYQHLTEHYRLAVLPETLFNGFFSTMDFLEKSLSTLPI